MDQHVSEERLTAFVDNQVEEPEADQIRRHLESCNRCATCVREMQLLFAGLDELSPAPATTGLKEETMALLRIAGQQPRSFGSRIGFRLFRDSQRLVAAGAIAAGLSIGIMFGNIAYQGLVPDNGINPFPSVVLQDDDLTINDSYVAMIINEEQGY